MFWVTCFAISLRDDITMVYMRTDYSVALFGLNRVGILLLKCQVSFLSSSISLFFTRKMAPDKVVSSTIIARMP